MRHYKQSSDIDISNWLILGCLAVVLIVAPLFTIWYLPTDPSVPWSPLLATFWYLVGYFGPTTVYRIVAKNTLGPVELLFGGIGTSGFYGTLFAVLYSLYVLA